MHNVNQQEDVDLVVLNCLTLHEEAHNDKIYYEQESITSGDPPIDTCVIISQGVEVALDNQCIEG